MQNTQSVERGKMSRDRVVIVAGVAAVAALSLLFLIHGPERVPVPTNSMTTLAVSRDGRYIASSAAIVTCVYDTKTHRSYNLPQENADAWMHSHPIQFGIAFSPDGKTLANGGLNLSTVGSGSLSTWDLSTGKQLTNFPSVEVCNSLVKFTPDGKGLLTFGKYNTVCIHNLTTGAVNYRLTGHAGTVTDAAFSPDGTRIATCSAYPEARVIMWDVARRTQIWSVRNLPHTTTLTSVAFSPDGKELAVGSQSFCVPVLDTSTGAVLRSITIPQPNRNPSPLEATFDSIIRKFTNRPARLHYSPPHTAQQVAFTPDGSLLVTADDGDVELWSTRTWSIVRSMDGTVPIALSPDGKHLASAPAFADHDRSVEVWSLP